jgi:HPt (histidine-containing phosphotransfer) domain-containing protein
LAGLPVLAMTANAMAEDKERCLAAGMNDHIAKPIELEQMMRVLLKWVKPGATRPGAAKSLQAAPTRPVRASANVNAWPVIEGLDIELGLHRVLGKAPLYIKMLQKFTSSHANTAAQLRAALARADLATARRIAHTVKGLCGNIGAASLQAQAGEIETLLGEKQAGQPALESKIEAFDRALTAMSAAVTAAFAQKPALGAAHPPDREQARQLIEQLTHRLTASDHEASELYENSLDVLRAALGEAVFVRLDAAMRLLDFDEALRQLEFPPRGQDFSIESAA